MQVGSIVALVLGLAQLGCDHAADVPDTTSCASCAPEKMDHHDHASMHAGPCPDSPPPEGSSCTIDRSVTCPYPTRKGGFETWQCIATDAGTSSVWRRRAR